MLTPRRLTLGLAVLVLCGVSAFILTLDAGRSRASGGAWSPEGDEVMLASTDITAEIGDIDVTCDAMVGFGTLSKEESATWTVTPELSHCNYPVKVKGAWTATAVDSSEATLELPKEEKAVSIEISSSCTVNLESGGTLGSSGDYTTGVNGVEEPSTFEISSSSVTVKDSSKGCVTPLCSKEEAKVAVISGNLLLINDTSRETDIGV